jgi:hypothetical protein
MGGRLEQFKVEHNQLTGTISEAFSRMPKLRVLWLHHNQLTGTLPSNLGSSHSLVSVDTRYNTGLCGAFPQSLAVDWKWQWLHSQKVIQVRAAAPSSLCFF